MTYNERFQTNRSAPILQYENIKDNLPNSLIFSDRHNDKVDLVLQQEHIPFKDNSLTLIRISFKNFITNFDEITRVLHPRGEIHVFSPNKRLVNDLSRKKPNYEFIYESSNKDIVLICRYKTIEAEKIILPPSKEEYQHLVCRFLNEENIKPLSIIIPVRNEENNLPAFLKSLKFSLEQVPIKTEVIFVVNGCTDNSREIIDAFIQNIKLEQVSFSIINSGKGILRAFLKGIKARSFSGGYVCKLDADTVLDKYSIGMAYLNLISNLNLQVSYAQPMPLNSRSGIIDMGNHSVSLRSKRNYFVGRLAIFRGNPFEDINVELLLKSGILVEDLFLSFFFIYFYGLDSINTAPGSIIYSQTIKSFRDRLRSSIRIENELKKIENFFYAFKLFERLVERRDYNNTNKDLISFVGSILYKQIYHFSILLAKLLQSFINHQEWTRLESTKKNSEYKL